MPTHHRIELPPHLIDRPAVQMNPPPAELMESTVSLITDAVSKLRTDERFLATVWIDTKAGVNAATVIRANDNVQIVGWFGKRWDEPIEAGVAAVVRF